MNTKQNSTIASKPAIDPALQWINGATDTASDEATSQQADKQTKKQAGKLANQLNQEAAEPTAMLSVRVPAALIRQLRIRAATEGQQIQEIVAHVLRDYLEQD